MLQHSIFHFSLHSPCSRNRYLFISPSCRSECMDILNARLWIVFYLICFVAVLWATFLLIQGFMLVVSVAMVGIVLVFNCILLVGEIRAQARKKKEMERFLKGYIAGSDEQKSETEGENAR